MMLIAVASVLVAAVIINRAVDTELDDFAHRDLRFSATNAAEMAVERLPRGGRLVRAAGHGAARDRGRPRRRGRRARRRRTAGRRLAGVGHRLAEGERAPILVRGRAGRDRRSRTTRANGRRRHRRRSASTAASRRGCAALLVEAGIVAGGARAGARAAPRAVPRPAAPAADRGQRGGMGARRARDAGDRARWRARDHAPGRRRSTGWPRRCAARTSSAARRPRRHARASRRAHGRVLAASRRCAMASSTTRTSRSPRSRTTRTRVRRLVDDVDRLAEAQRPGLLVRKRPIDLDAIVLACVAGYADRCRAPDRSRSRIASSRRASSAIPSGWPRSLDNLLSNALRYTDSGGHVVVTLEVRDEHAVVQVGGLRDRDRPRLRSNGSSTASGEARPRGADGRRVGRRAGARLRARPRARRARRSRERARTAGRRSRCPCRSASGRRRPRGGPPPPFRTAGAGAASVGARRAQADPASPGSRARRPPRRDWAGSSGRGVRRYRKRDFRHVAGLLHECARRPTCE